MIHVNAEITIKDDQREAFLREFHILVPLVHAEQGCMYYEPCVDLPTEIAEQEPVRDNVVTVRETWKSVAALQAHLVAPHMDAYRDKVKDMVESLSLRIYEAG